MLSALSSMRELALISASLLESCLISIDAFWAITCSIKLRQLPHWIWNISCYPNPGLISFGEMVDQGRQTTEVVSIPIIGDGDNGHENAMNAKRTVKGYIRSGFAGIILEDQVSPKACGCTQGRRVVPREEAVMKIKAAIDARKESGSDIVMVARTDSCQAVSLEESLCRSSALDDAGANVLFIDALVSKEEVEGFCEVSPLVPKMANMLEGGGRTPILSPIELADVR